MTMEWNEKERLRGFICEVAAFMDDVAGESEGGLAASLADAVRSADHLDGLRQAAGDMVEWAVDLSAEYVEQLDERLLHAQLPSLSQMRDRQYRRIHRILAARQLRNDGDYRLLHQVLSDTESTVLSGGDRRRAEHLLAEYYERER